MNFDMVIQQVRYLLLLLGPILATKGYMTEGNWELIVGAIISVATIAWGTYVRWNTATVPAKTGARSDVPTLNPVTGKRQ